MPVAMWVLQQSCRRMARPQALTLPRRRSTATQPCSPRLALLVGQARPALAILVGQARPALLDDAAEGLHVLLQVLVLRLLLLGERPRLWVCRRTAVKVNTG
jgi:hypothetical protein